MRHGRYNAAWSGRAAESPAAACWLRRKVIRPPRRIALLISQDIAFCRRVLQGIDAYALTRNWVFHDAPADVRVLTPMRRW